MTLAQIKENIFPEDKIKVSVQLVCSYKYVDMVLKGDREVESKLATAIFRALHTLALINIRANGAKNAALIAISSQILQEAA